MAQDWNAFVSGTTVFSDNFFNKLAQNLATLRTMFSGSSAPASPVTDQLWLDKSGATPRLKIYAGASWQDITDYFYDFVLAQAELAAARGSAASLDARLDVALNEDGTLKTTTTSSTWVSETAAVAYASGSSFTITGQDRTAVYATGRALKLTQTVSGYAKVAAASYAGGNTTVTVYGGTVDAGLSKVEYSHQPEAVPYGEAGTANKGVSERATDAEASALSDTERHLTPANLAAVLSDHAAFPGCKNLFVNGGCQVQQRSSVSISGSRQFGPVDRWQVFGTNLTAGTVGSAAPAATDVMSGACIQITGLSANAGGDVYFSQRIEAKDARRFVGKKVSIRCRFYHSISGTKNLSMNIHRANAADNFSTTTLVLNSSATAVTGGAWTTVKFEGLDLSSDSNIANGLQIAFYFECGAITSQTISIGLMQIEEGSVCTDFELRPFAQELAMCQRYFDKSYNLADAPGTVTLNGCLEQTYRGSNRFYEQAIEKFKQRMRTSPTVTVYSTQTGASGKCSDLTSDYTATVQNLSERGFFIICGYPTANTEIYWHWAAAAEL